MPQYLSLHQSQSYTVHCVSRSQFSPKIQTNSFTAIRAAPPSFGHRGAHSAASVLIVLPIRWPPYYPQDMKKTSTFSKENHRRTYVPAKVLFRAPTATNAHGSHTGAAVKIESQTQFIRLRTKISRYRLLYKQLYDILSSNLNEKKKIFYARESWRKVSVHNCRFQFQCYYDSTCCLDY